MRRESRIRITILVFATTISSLPALERSEERPKPITIGGVTFDPKTRYSPDVALPRVDLFEWSVELARPPRNTDLYAAMVDFNVFPILSGSDEAVVGPLPGASVAQMVGADDGRSDELYKSYQPHAFTGTGARDAPAGWIIQFNGDLSDARKDELEEEFGLAFVEYVHELAFIERTTEQTILDLKRKYPGEYRAHLPLMPEVRSSLDLSPERDSAIVLSDDWVSVRVIAWDAEAADEIVDELETIERDLNGVTVDGETRWFSMNRPVVQVVEGMSLKPRILVTLWRRLLEPLARMDGVRWIEPLAERQFDGHRWPGIVQSGHPKAHPYWRQRSELNGRGQIITVYDEGTVDENHCWFAESNDRDNPRGKVLYRSDHESRPHATFLAGIAAGHHRDCHGRPFGDCEKDCGLGWGAQLVSIGGAKPKGKLIRPDLAEAAGQGARIHLNSWHEKWPAADYTYRGLDEEVDEFTWSNEMNLVIGSSGNIESTGPPGTAKNAISVSASWPPGRLRARVRGTDLELGEGGFPLETDGRRKPDLAAPGCEVESSQFGTDCEVVACDQLFDDHCGSSWAAAYVAGAAAIARQYFTEGWHPSGTRVEDHGFEPSAALLKAVLLNATLDMAGDGLDGFPGAYEGWGHLELVRSLHLAACDEQGRTDCSRRLRVEDVHNADGIAREQCAAYRVRVVSGREPLRVTLNWTDPPGTVGCIALENDLDLIVVPPGGRDERDSYLGNVFANDWSRAGGVFDDRNTVEQVAVEEPDDGVWTILVHGRSFRGRLEGASRQGFALAVSGDLEPVPIADVEPEIVGASLTDCLPQ